MQAPSNRSAVVIAALLTLIVLGGTTFGLAFHNGWLRTGSGARGPEAIAVQPEPAVPGSAFATTPLASTSSADRSTSTPQEEIAAYRQKLEEAYRALDEAYAQIRALQTAQPRLAAHREGENTRVEHDGRDDDRERRSRRNHADDDER